MIKLILTKKIIKYLPVIFDKDEINYDEEFKENTIKYYDDTKYYNKDYNRFKEEMSPLNFAIETKNCEIIQLLLNHPTIDVNSKNINKIIELLSNNPKIDINFGKKHDLSVLYIYNYQDWNDSHSSCIYHKVINYSQTLLFMSIDKKSTTFCDILMKNSNIKYDILSSIDNCNELEKKREKIYSQFGNRSEQY